MSCSYERNVGPFVLGTLEPSERSAVAAHIEGCERCQAVKDEFAALPGLLSRLSAEDIEARLAHPEESAYERLLTAASAERAARRRRRRRWTAAAAAAVVLVAGIATAVALGRSPDGPATTRTAAAGPVQAKATVAGTESGSRLTVELNGVPAGQHCRLVAFDRAGQRDVAGSWVANYAGWAKITSTTSWTPEQLDRLVVETFSGRRLVTIPVTGDQ